MRTVRLPLASSALADFQRHVMSLSLKWESVAFVTVNVLDIILTYILLTSTTGLFFESNPFARYVLERWSFSGMIVFKLGLVLLVMLNCYIIARQRPDVARLVLAFGIVTVFGVVGYSSYLYLTYA